MVQTENIEIDEYLVGFYEVLIAAVRHKAIILKRYCAIGCRTRFFAFYLIRVSYPAYLQA